MDCNAGPRLFWEAGQNIRGRGSGFPQASDRLVLVSFREAAALCVGDQGVVEVFRLGKVQQGLEEPVVVGGREQVFAAGDERDFLKRVIDDDGEVVGGSNVLSREHDIAECTGVDDLLAETSVEEGKGACFTGSGLGIESPRGILASCDPGMAFIRRKAAAGAWIEWAFRAMGRRSDPGNFFLDLAACAEAGVDHSRFAEPIEGFMVGIQAIRLPERFAMPRQAEPAQVFFNRGVEFLADPGGVDVFKAKEKSPA